MNRVIITFKTYQDGNESVTIDSHYAHGRDPQLEGGKYRKPRTFINPSEASVERLRQWMRGRTGSCGNGWYVCHI